ncbi:hypothetical protein I41_25830 [Lacipirellula limnantheis]|uniref:Uncharacterized protein n=1 Tax=Lacipirellula limnantheis TaxID=2528024 RepID=A0A517TYE3_9BACT|nr:hypothetical protein I41_25830 [Lacipirellula limnantheis]
MAATIEHFCKACHSQHEFYLPEELTSVTQYRLEYTCPKTERRMSLDLDGNWNEFTPQVDEGSVIVRRVPW